jgi:phospholipase/carboxylesterase
MTLVHAIAHPGDAASGEPLPTLIALHGYGANGQDLLGLAPYLGGGRLLMICPQAPLQVEPGFYGFSWYQFAGPGGQSDPAELERALGLVRDFVDFALDAYPVRRDRVALLGFSQGGGMAYRLALGEPERFVGLAALSTRLPADLFAEQPPSEAVAALPLLIQHGAEDPTASVDGGRASRDRLRELGLEPDYREYPMGHEVSAASAGDLSAWLDRVLFDGPA